MSQRLLRGIEDRVEIRRMQRVREPTLEGAEEGEDRFEGEVGPLESDRYDSNPSSAT